MEPGPEIKVPSDKLEKPGIESVTTGIQGEWFIHYTTAASVLDYNHYCKNKVHIALSLRCINRVIAQIMNVKCYSCDWWLNGYNH